MVAVSSRSAGDSADAPLITASLKTQPLLRPRPRPRPSPSIFMAFSEDDGRGRGRGRRAWAFLRHALRWRPQTLLRPAITPLINTLLQRGMSRLGRRRNRFSGLPHAVETVKTVQQPAPLGFTSLKRGVNERGAHERSFGSQKSGLSALLEPLSRKSDRPIFNFQFSIFNFQSPLRFSLLVLALGVLAVRLDAAAPARPTNAPPVKTGLDDLLQLFDGSSLHGRLRSMTTETGLRWQHPEARAPIDFRPTNVAWIRFDESEPAAPHSRPTAPT